MWYIKRIINNNVRYWKQNSFNTVLGSLDGYWVKDPNSAHLFKSFKQAEKVRIKLKKYTPTLSIRIRYLRECEYTF